jgi:hypothetical protein
MVEQTFEFEATIRSAGRGSACVDLPFDAAEAFGSRGRVPITATFDGHPYRGSLFPMSGRHMLMVRKDVREAIGKDVGDTVAVTVRRDTEPRVVAVPDDLQAELDASPRAREIFEGLSYTHRKEYVAWIEEAKRPETRERRIRRTVEMLLEGKTR